jgi:hypothetical protein
MRKIVLLIPLFALSCSLLQAQDDDMPAPSSHPKPQEYELPGTDGYVHSSKHKIDLSNYIIEPDLQLAIGSGAVNVGISPYIGYRVWKNLYAGGGLTYLFTDFNNIGYADISGGIHYTNAYWHTFGGGVFLQYNVWKGLFVRNRFEVLHRIMDDVYDAHLELNTQGNTYNIVMPKIQKTIPADLVGVGYNLLQSKSFFFPLMFSYNVLYSVTNKVYSVYPRGWEIQLGFVDVF